MAGLHAEVDLDLESPPSPTPAPTAGGRRERNTAGTGAAFAGPAPSGPSTTAPQRPYQGNADKVEAPSWGGELSTWNAYRRRVQVWVAATGTPADKRAAQLIIRLSGTAWECTESLDLSTLAHDGGVSPTCCPTWSLPSRSDKSTRWLPHWRTSCSPCARNAQKVSTAS